MSKFILLTQNQQAEVSEEDYDFLMQYKWQALFKRKKNYYAVHSFRDKNKRGNVSLIQMHRLIMERVLLEQGKLEELDLFKKYPLKFPVDHIDGNTLKNTRENLRVVSPRENSQNRHHKRTSKHPGVYWDDKKGKWGISLYLKDRPYLGFFTSEKEAAEVYQEACKAIESGNFKQFLEDLTERLHTQKSGTSRYRGVYWSKTSKKWAAAIKKDKKRKFLGYFSNELDAYNAYKKARKELYGS